MNWFRNSSLGNKKEKDWEIGVVVIKGSAEEEKSANMQVKNLKVFRFEDSCSFIVFLGVLPHFTDIAW